MKKKNITLFLIIFVLIVSVACNKNSDAQPASTHLSKVEELYKYKNTYVGDNSKVVAIVDLLLTDGVKRDKVELFTENEPCGIKVSYILNNITQIQDSNILKLNKAASIMLGLIDNANFIELEVKNENNEVIYNSKVTREILKDYFLNSISFDNATSSQDKFSEFYKVVTEYSLDSYINKKISEIIPKDRQIMVNSGEVFTFVLKNNIKTENFNLESIIKDNGLNLIDYYGQKIDAYIYVIETSALSSQQYTSSPYIFIFNCDNLLGYKDLKNFEVENEIKPYLIQQTQESSGYKGDVVKYVQNYFTKAYESYYEVLGFETVDDYAYETKDGNLSATFMFKMKYKNYYKDPDTVDYIKEAKEKGSKEYKTLYDEYNEEQELNFSLKVTAAIKDGNIDMDTIKIYNDNSEKGKPKYIEIENFLPKN